jgi:hypothetical protein
MFFCHFNFKNGKMGLVLMAIDRISINSKMISGIHIDELSQAQFSGSILLLNTMTDSHIVWEGKYGDRTTIEGQYCLSFTGDLKDFDGRPTVGYDLNKIKNALEVLKPFAPDGSLIFKKINTPYNDQIMDIMKMTDEQSKESR